MFGVLGGVGGGVRVRGEGWVDGRRDCIPCKTAVKPDSFVGFLVRRYYAASISQFHIVSITGETYILIMHGTMGIKNTPF